MHPPLRKVCRTLFRAPASPPRRRAVGAGLGGHPCVAGTRCRPFPSCTQRALAPFPAKGFGQALLDLPAFQTGVCRAANLSCRRCKNNIENISYSWILSIVFWENQAKTCFVFRILPKCSENLCFPPESFCLTSAIFLFARCAAHRGLGRGAEKGPSPRGRGPGRGPGAICASPGSRPR